METLFFKVADILFTIQGKSADELKKLLPSYAPFNIAATDAKPALSLTVEDGAIDTSAVGEELGQFDCGGSNHGIYRTEQGYKIIISTVEGNVASAMLTNADFSVCKVSLFGNDADRLFGIGNAMMIAFAFAAAYYDTILMHASVTMNEGRGYLFLGKSGTGKSTHSKLWMKHIAGSDLLNDDNPAVRFTPQGAIVYGTPWSGKTPCYRNLQVPIGGLICSTFTTSRSFSRNGRMLKPLTLKVALCPLSIERLISVIKMWLGTCNIRFSIFFRVMNGVMR